MRLFRLAKLQKIRDTYMDLQQTAEWATLVMKMVLMQVGFSIFMHFAGCMWHAVGSSVTQERTWIMDFEERNEREFESVLERYLESLHWAYSQITPTSSAVSPQTQLFIGPREGVFLLEKPLLRKKEGPPPRKAK